MQHGLVDSGGTWLWLPSEQQPLKTLANEGYDIWVGNSRGTTYSSRHVNLTRWNTDYWNFSFHEMGKYDVPANIHYILNKTGVDKLTYIGHS
jgi:pimeloyl-ACP methyl ester carboxylesterase